MQKHSDYRHTQFGTLLLIVFVAAAVVIVSASLSGGTYGPALIAVPVLAVIFALFGTLTVVVGEERLECRFGPGLIRRRVALADVERAEAISLPWYYGWGVRFTPQGWLYRVSGTTAVRLTLTGGKRVLIGTDEPGRLVRAIAGRRPGVT
jgi:hypothetical protein